MAKGHGPTVHVDLGGIEVHELHVGESDNGEGLVYLMVVNVGESQAGVGDGPGSGKGGSSSEILGSLLGVGKTKNTGDGLWWGVGC